VAHTFSKEPKRPNFAGDSSDHAQFFSYLLKSGQASVQVLLDGTDSNTANIVQGYVQSVAAAYNQELQVELLNNKGLTRQEMPIDSQIRFWFNEDLESRNYIVPGLIAVIMTVLIPAASMTRASTGTFWQQSDQTGVRRTASTPSSFMRAAISGP